MTGADVKKIRHVMHMTQKEFAIVLKVSPSLVEKWETGDKTIAEYHADHILHKFYPTILDSLETKDKN